MRYTEKNGGTPTAYHVWWMSEVKVDYNSADASENWAWCKFFEILLRYDVIDGAKLISAELGARRVKSFHE